jgi:hypothetical protein
MKRNVKVVTLLVALIVLCISASAQHLAITGTNSDPTVVYVDSGAASANATGSAMKPFRLIADALELCPPLLTQRGDFELYYNINASGNFVGVSVDRAIVINGPCTLDNITLEGTSERVLLFNCTINDLTIEAPICDIVGSVVLGDLILTGVEHVVIKDSVVSATIDFDENAEGETEIVFMNSYVPSLVEVPVSGFTVSAINTAFTDPDNTGTIELINSYQEAVD